ncbi:MAG: hypothetical protein U1F83_04790 [Verrucomicrobiota bacterium]
MKITVIRYCFVLLLVLRLLTATVDAGEPNESVFSEPLRTVLRLKDSLPVSPLFLPEKTIFFLLDTEAGDPRSPYRNLVSRLKYSFSMLEGPHVGFRCGGLELQKSLLASQAFAESVSITSVETNIIATPSGLVTNLTLTTNSALARYAVLYTKPQFSIDAQIIDATEEPSETKSKRLFGSFLIGNFIDAVTLETAFRWRSSIAHAHIIVTVYEFQTGLSRAQGSVRAQIIKKERGKSFSIRYIRAAGSYDSDSTAAVTLEAALTEATTLAFAQALANLYGIPLGKFSNQPSSEANRAAVERAWVLAPIEGRRRALSLRNLLAAEGGETPAFLSSPLAAAHWRELLESATLRFPAEPFDRFPLANVGRQCRIVFEQFPAQRWQALKMPIANLLAQFPNAIVEPDPEQPDIAFRLKRSTSFSFFSLRPVNPEDVRRFVAVKFHQLAGIAADTQVSGQTVCIKYRPSLPIVP